MIINQDYKDQLAAMHGQGRFRRGSKIISTMNPFLKQYQPTSILDFGCGHGEFMHSIREAYPDITVDGYDPGSATHSEMPVQDFDCVVSADVFEHIEPNHLAETLHMISNKMIVAGWFRIACYPAKKHLPDGRNAHLIVESPAWWREQLLANMDITIVSQEISVFDKSHKWPNVVGHNYDVVAEVK
jgi:cyclopropane fatty-acyl-phospholipid synthase-like methyltransferase